MKSNEQTGGGRKKRRSVDVEVKTRTRRQAQSGEVDGSKPERARVERRGGEGKKKSVETLSHATQSCRGGKRANEQRERVTDTPFRGAEKGRETGMTAKFIKAHKST